MVTGGNGSLGKATAKKLASMGATVVILCRSRERGEEAGREICEVSGNRSVEVLVGDLSAQESVRDMVKQFLASYQHLHVLVNNAPVFLNHRSLTADGFGDYVCNEPSWTVSVDEPVDGSVDSKCAFKGPYNLCTFYYEAQLQGFAGGEPFRCAGNVWSVEAAIFYLRTNWLAG